MGFFGRKFRAIARIGKKAIGVASKIGRIGSKAYDVVSKIPGASHVLGNVSRDVKKIAGNASEVAAGLKNVKKHGMDLLRGDVGAAHQILKEGHNVMKASKQVRDEAKNVLEKAKKTGGNPLKYV